MLWVSGWWVEPAAGWACRSRGALVWSLGELRRMLAGPPDARVLMLRSFQNWPGGLWSSDPDFLVRSIEHRLLPEATRPRTQAGF
jgi:hypothetical protein